MDEVILKKLEEQEKKIEAIFVSVEKTRKYILASLIISILFFVLPLVAALFIVPIVFSTLAGIYGSI